MWKTRTLELLVAVILGSTVATAAQSDETEFYAYYTRLEHPDTPDRQLTGKYADIVVHLKSGAFIFSRQYSYLPYWKVGPSQWLVEELIKRKGDGPAERPDDINKCSSVRILESTGEKIVIHWRYAPDISGPHFTRFETTYTGSMAEYFRDYADEYFAITPGGRVTRTLRQARDRIDEYNDPSNITLQTLDLTAGGIANVRTQPADPHDTPGLAVQGAPVRTEAVVKPVAWWKFDEGLRDRPVGTKYITKESVRGTPCAIAGNTSVWNEGVSGTCLVFDGYSSKVTLPASEVVPIAHGLTVEAWVAPQEYSWNWSGIVDHSRNEDAGYFLGMNYLGQVAFRVKAGPAWKACITEHALPLHKWSHVAGVYDPEFGLAIYVDGQRAAAQAAHGALQDAVGTDLDIGMSHERQCPAFTERKYSQSFLSNMVFDGLIDEVRIYDSALAEDQVAARYTALRPQNTKPLDYRVLATGQKGTGTFGASYARVRYSRAWDEMWRVGEHPDIVVNFEEDPIQMVFWRGTSYSLSCITDNNIWVSDQSPESGGPKGCAEHMSDKHGRFTHVRLIENTDARVVVHWRVASATIDYLFNSKEDKWGEWTDEYYSIYPDGVAVRYQEIHGNPPAHLFEVQQHEMLNQPGTRPQDNGADQLITLVNMDGQTERWTWEKDKNGERLDVPIDKPVIEYMNLNSKYKHFVIGEAGSVWKPIRGFGARADYSNMNCWNHWPVAMLPSDGRVTVTPDRPSSTCVGTLHPVRHDINRYLQVVQDLYGLTDKSPSALALLARSWNNPPQVAGLSGGTSQGYAKGQRAYLFRTEEGRLTFMLNASEETPLVNPCLVIQNCPGRNKHIQLEINGALLRPEEDYREGIITDTDGTPTMVVWLRHEASGPTFFRIKILGP